MSHEVTLNYLYRLSLTNVFFCKCAGFKNRLKILNISRNIAKCYERAQEPNISILATIADERQVRKDHKRNRRGGRVQGNRRHDTNVGVDMGS
ncbi:hypothetical protein K435DRAFT_857286 [Dendrothele bispora CBS 962.96]|uniref:Uncharacterized protein n=1 Tax=Dendrothele bispora (strain CBS 962.96) TaxID=1314807 RepID=A0A4S8M6U1_DENBC|nr:hypothetical protein K435DRAFT_857286 [Dendrothele bispora CBS 962.96]